MTVVDAILGSARGPRAGFGVAPKQSFSEKLPTRQIDRSEKKFAIARRARQARETHALPKSQRDRYSYFFTISAFSSMAMPPRSAIFPFNVIVFPQYSAN